MKSIRLTEKIKIFIKKNIDIRKSNLENLYFFASVIMVISVIIAITQVNVAKEQMKLTSDLESSRLTIDLCEKIRTNTILEKEDIELFFKKSNFEFDKYNIGFYSQIMSFYPRNYNLNQDISDIFGQIKPFQSYQDFLGNDVFIDNDNEIRKSVNTLELQIGNFATNVIYSGAKEDLAFKLGGNYFLWSMTGIYYLKYTKRQLDDLKKVDDVIQSYRLLKNEEKLFTLWYLRAKIENLKNILDNQQQRLKTEKVDENIEIKKRKNEIKDLEKDFSKMYTFIFNKNYHE